MEAAEPGIQTPNGRQHHRPGGPESLIANTSCVCRSLAEHHACLGRAAFPSVPATESLCGADRGA